MRARALLLLLLVAVTARVAHAEGPEHYILAEVHIGGRTLEPPDRLAAFLGLVPGAPWDDAVAGRVIESLRVLGYQDQPLVSTRRVAGGGVALDLTIEPARLVRHVRVHGNWPVLRAIFNEDVLRRMTLRPGSRLPHPTEIPALLARESERVRDYLHREGFFNAEAKVVLKEAGRPEWADLDVQLKLGPWFSIGHVEANGNAAVKSNEIGDSFVHSFPPTFWSRFRVDRMHEDARAAEQRYRGRGYPAARVFPDFDPKVDVDGKAGKVRLRLKVLEKGRVDIRFVGNEEFTPEQLRQKVTIFSAGSYDETELVESARELQRLYQTRGYLEAHVRYRLAREGDVRVITFIVDEGPELKVEQVDFAPEPWARPLSFGDDELRKQVVTRRFPFIGQIRLAEGGYVTGLQLGQDVDRLLAFYRAQGFSRARVRGVVARDPIALDGPGVLGADVAAGIGRSGEVHVRFYIDEGPRQQLGGVEFRFVGAHRFTAEDLVRATQLHAGDPVSPEALELALKRLKKLYDNQGHPHALVDSGVERAPGTGELGVVADLDGRPRLSAWDEERTRLYLVFLVDEGPLVRFGEVLVRGNFRTAESVIRQDLPFRTGDLFSAELVDRAVQNLQTHQVFNSVRVVRVPPGDLPRDLTVIPILVEVQERYDNWGAIEAAIGYSTDVGLSASLGYVWGNVFGGGGQLEIRGDLALDIFRQPASTNIHAPFYRVIGGTLRYSHLHLVLPSLRGDLQGFARKESTPALGEIISYGGRATLTWVPSPSLRLFGRFELTRSNLQSIELERLPARNDFRTSVSDATTIAKFTAGAVYDRRVSVGGARNPLLPLAGWLLAGQASVSPFPNHYFVTLGGQAQHFQPIGRAVGDNVPVTLIFNARGDWGFPIGEPALPAVERFFAGGDDRTRGFATDRLRTEIVRGDVSPAPDLAGYRIIPQGGNIRFLATVELQFPIAKIGSFPWVGAVFFDAGTIFDRPSLFDVGRDVKASVGISLVRLLTPLGPLSVEYAYPLTQTLAEQEWRRDPWYLHWPGRIHFNWGIPILR